MLISNTQETLKEKVGEVSETHCSYLKHLEGFPMECVWSSHIMGSYLLYNGYDTQVIYGTFGEHNLFHAWLEIDGKILDYTLFQFLTKKEKQSFYQKLTGREMMNYLEKFQGDYWIDEENKYFSQYNKMAVMAHQFTNDFEDLRELGTHTYKEFYENLWGSDAYFRFGIKNAKVQGNNETFEQFLLKKGLRMGKKFFTKLCIVDN